MMIGWGIGLIFLIGNNLVYNENLKSEQQSPQFWK